VESSGYQSMWQQWMPVNVAAVDPVNVAAVDASQCGSSGYQSMWQQWIPVNVAAVGALGRGYKSHYERHCL